MKTFAYRLAAVFAGMALGFSVFNTASLDAAELVISEFMASNGGTISDEDGESSDWIEIHNVGTNTVNLLNWALTDSANNLNKWRFPSTNLGPNRFLLVWASGKNRREPGRPLHTSFRLSAEGRFLALVRPDGTIESQYAPAYPQQFQNVSYGLPVLASNYVLVATNGIARIRVPVDGSLGTNWLLADYDDTAWATVTNGIGFDTGTGGAGGAQILLNATPRLYYRFNETSGTTAINSATNVNHLTLNGVTLGVPGVRPPGQSGFEANNTAASFNGSSSFATAGSAMIVGAQAFTMMAWIRPTATPRARDGLFGQNDSLEFGWLNPGTPQIHLWTPGGSFSWNYPYPLNEWHHIAAVGDATGIRLYVDGVQVASGTGSASYGTSASPFNVGGGGILDASGNYFTGDIDELAVWLRALSPTEITQIYQGALTPTSLGNLVRSDVRSAMQNQNATIYARFKFNLDDPLAVDRLLLRMRYEDGFAAFLNGQLVASANDPETLSWNSAATADRGKGEAQAWETFDLADYLSLLRPGNNVLAIQGLNENAASGDFLLEATLSYTSAGNYESVPRYFLTATPGDFNGIGTFDLGPVISGEDYSPRPQPNPGQSLTITAKVTPTFNAVSNVLLYYRVMYNNSSVISMRDDGTGGDITAGDSIYTATIPGATNGQMIRWYFQAQDVQGRSSRWPLFQDPLGSAEYFGTVVADSNLTSKLPIIHLFVSNYTANVGVDDPNKTGGRASVFYDGEFYDNVFMRVRGNSTRTYTKKSHRLEFNREHPFRHPGPGGMRLRKTSFVADWPDPTYMRQGLSFWLCEMFGVPSPFYHPVRLQMNGAFYQLANHNDLHGEELLERFGWDPNGALYNAAGQVTPGKASTGGFDKKTRRWDTTDADYLDLANKIAESVPTETRRINALDLFDVPNVLNYLAVARWVHENDDVWANMSLYHDNDGDGLWRIIPFDMNLSWGAIFAEGSADLYTGVQATNDNHKAHPLYGSSQTLALSGPSGAYNRVYDTFFLVPQLRQMYLRRLRTLMDTWILPPETPPGASPVEQRIFALRDYLAEEAIRDRARWGWPAVGGQNNFNPGIDVYTGVQQMIEQFLYARRRHFFGKHCITNTALTIGITKTSNAGIPLPQPTNAVLDIVSWEVNPPTGNQDQEYICITNRNNLALDISGWRLHGGVRFTFKPGTVVPATGAVYVARSITGFKSRTTGPRPGQGLFVVGGYDGQLSTWGDVILLSDDRGRLVSSNSYAPSPSLAQQFLRITEVMYNPPAVVGDPTFKEEYEFVELKNISTNVTLDLTGVRFTTGIEFTFTNSAVTSLAPGQRVLVVKNRTAFTNRYGAGLSIAGEYDGYLNNDGETLRLVDASGEKILEFTYNNNWQQLADGLGASLVVVDELADWRTWENPNQWRTSTTENGSPGQDDLTPPPLLPVYVNELMANSGTTGGDWVELYNPNPTDVSLANWYLTDDFNTPRKYRFPANATIPANGYLVLTEAQFNANGQGFAFGAGGDDVYLFSGNSVGQLTGYYHGFSFGASPVGVSYGRHVTELGDELFVLQSSTTMGAANSGPLSSPIVISEIMYRPPDSLEFDPIGFNPSVYVPVDNTRDEFIELWNTTTNNIALGSTTGTNSWRLRGGVDFDFPANAVIPAGGYVLLVNFNPADAALASAFRALYQVPQNVALFGPYQGKLNNDSDIIRLQQYFQGNYVDMDAFTYRDYVPWPCGADGSGRSLQRLSATELGADPLNWVSLAPTPAAPTVPQPRGLASLVTGPANVAVATNGTAVLSVDVCSAYPVSYQWRFNGQDLPGENNPLLVIANAQLSQSGYYSVVVSNRAGAFETAPAWVSVQLPPVITEQPASQEVLGFTDVALRVGVGPTPPYWVQWKFNGLDYYLSTNTVLVLTNVQKVQQGQYQAVVWNAAGAVTSGVAVLTVNVPARVVGQPVDVVATNGTTAVIRSVVVGDGVVKYQWYNEAGPVVGGTNMNLSLANVQEWQGGRYWLVVSNAYGMDTSVVARLTVYVKAGFAVSPGHEVVTMGEELRLGVVVTGTPPYRLVWQRAATPVWTNYTWEGASEFRWGMMLLNEAGLYRAVVTNVATTGSGVSSSFGNVTVVAPVGDREVVEGSSVVIRAVVAPVGTVSYQWRREGTNVPGAVGTNLVLSPVEVGHGGQWTFVVSNSAGRVKEYPMRLEVRGSAVGPGIVAGPTNVVGEVGGKALLRVVASGTEPLSYQWWREGTNAVVGGTNAFLGLMNLGETNVGRYVVVVSNGVGVVTSGVAVVSMAVEDSDGDGLPDEWERANGLVVGVDDRWGDEDGDGVGNWEEYVAGTDPRGRGSVLKWEEVVRGSGGGLSLRFEAKGGREYVVEYVGALGGTNWVTLERVDAVGSNRWVEVPVGVGLDAQRYYRLGVRLPSP